MENRNVSSTSTTSDNMLVVSKGMKRLENPFALKVGQVFTGFGIGCGIGIGVGRPLNLGAIPMLNQVMSATRGATDAFSGVGRHVNSSLKKFGAKNIEAGIGCGVGFGHGFGVGLAIKPGVLHQIQSGLVQVITSMMVKFGISPSLSVGQGFVPVSVQDSMRMINQPLNQNPVGHAMQLQKKVVENPLQGISSDPNTSIGYSGETFLTKHAAAETPYSSRTEQVISNFLQNPLLKDENSEPNDLAGRLRSENNILQMVLKHQQIIEELMQENEKLRQILVEDLKIPPQKLQTSFPNSSKFLCTECFECRRKQRKR